MSITRWDTGRISGRLEVQAVLDQPPYWAFPLRAEWPDGCGEALPIALDQPRAEFGGKAFIELWPQLGLSAVNLPARWDSGGDTRLMLNVAQPSAVCTGNADRFGLRVGLNTNAELATQDGRFSVRLGFPRSGSSLEVTVYGAGAGSAAHLHARSEGHDVVHRQGAGIGSDGLLTLLQGSPALDVLRWEPGLGGSRH
ncbi:MAG: hypothetical protein MJD61_08270 [Proteobacteria bacterium]|nr:hypothetical protein [Pseudomonadota bacterium]